MFNAWKRLMLSAAAFYSLGGSEYSYDDSDKIFDEVNEVLYETERLEFKESWTDDLYKEVIAFANADGGTILVGVNDKGEAVGLEDVDDTYTRITYGIRDAILPDATIFVKYTLEQGASFA